MADLLRSLGRYIASILRKISGAEPTALPPIRRVVTGHDATGHSTVKSDTTIAPEPATGPGSAGLSGGGLWTTDSVPSKDTNDDGIGGALRPVEGFVMRNGTNLRFTDLAPGSASPMHRTSSIDYNILSKCFQAVGKRPAHGMHSDVPEVSGKLILILDDGSETLIGNPGDVVVQRGNMHAWKNPGPGVARWVSVLVDAKPAIVNGKPLEDAWLA